MMGQQKKKPLSKRELKEYRGKLAKDGRVAKQPPTRCNGIAFDKFSLLFNENGYLERNYGDLIVLDNSIRLISPNCETVATYRNEMCTSCYSHLRGCVRSAQYRVEQKGKKIEEAYQEKLNELKNQILKENDRSNLLHPLASQLQKALDEGKMTKDHFFFKLLVDTLQNLERKPNGFRFSKETIQWCLCLRFLGGSSLWKALRGEGERQKNGEGILKAYNLLIPSIDTLKKYVPKIEFGGLNEELLKEILQEIVLKGHSSRLVVAYDEIEVRAGLVFHPPTNQVIGWTNE